MVTAPRKRKKINFMRDSVVRSIDAEGIREVEVIVCFSAGSTLFRDFSLWNPLRAQERRRFEPCHVFRMNLHDVPPCTYVTFCCRTYVCVCARAGQHVGRDSLQPADVVVHLPVAPSRYETLGMIIPYLPTETGPYRLVGFFVRLDSI